MAPILVAATCVLPQADAAASGQGISTSRMSYWCDEHVTQVCYDGGLFSTWIVLAILFCFLIGAVYVLRKNLVDLFINLCAHADKVHRWWYSHDDNHATYRRRYLCDYFCGICLVIRSVIKQGGGADCNPGLCVLNFPHLHEKFFTW